MTTIPPPPDKRHYCDELAPSRSGPGYGATGVADGTLWCCPLCHRWWVSQPCYESYGPTTAWYKVRWYHFRLRCRILDHSTRYTR